MAMDQKEREQLIRIAVQCTVENWFESGDWAAWNIRVTGTHTGEMMGIRATGRMRCGPRPCSKVSSRVGAS